MTNVLMMTKYALGSISPITYSDIWMQIQVTPLVHGGYVSAAQGYLKPQMKGNPSSIPPEALERFFMLIIFLLK